VLHTLTSWPAVVKAYSPNAWIVPGRIPLESSWDYRLAKTIESHTTREDRILDLYGVQAAHVERNFIVSWQSAGAEVLLRGLEFARLPGKQDLYQWRADFPEQPVTSVRVRQTAAADTIWSVCEIELYLHDLRLPNRGRWSLDGNPNPWETPLAFDRNYASRWMTWQRARPDQWLGVDFEGTERLTAVKVAGTIWDGLLPLRIELRRPDGAWHTAPAHSSLLPGMDLRKDAVAKLRRAGIRYIVASGELGGAMTGDPDAWGLEIVDRQNTVTLLRIL
jgi:hypothetical protein